MHSTSFGRKIWKPWIMNLTTTNKQRNKQKNFLYFTWNYLPERIRIPCAFSCPFTWRLITCLVVSLLMLLYISFSLDLTLSENCEKRRKNIHIQIDNHILWYYSILELKVPSPNFPDLLKHKTKKCYTYCVTLQ